MASLFSRLIIVIALVAVSSYAQPVRIDLTNHDIGPEGVEYHSSTGFLVGSLQNGGVYQVSDSGDVVKLVQVTGRSYGLEVSGDSVYFTDSGSKRHYTASLPSGTITSQVDTTAGIANDVSRVEKVSTSYITDSAANQIISVSGGVSSVWSSSTVYGGAFLNGIQEVPGSFLVTSGYANGKFFLTAIADPLNPTEIAVDLNGFAAPTSPDGLVYSKASGRLYCVSRLALYGFEAVVEGDWSSIRVVERIPYPADVSNPTTACLANNHVYVLFTVLTGGGDYSIVRLVDATTGAVTPAPTVAATTRAPTAPTAAPPTNLKTLAPTPVGATHSPTLQPACPEFNVDTTNYQPTYHRPFILQPRYPRHSFTCALNGAGRHRRVSVTAARAGLYTFDTVHSHGDTLLELRRSCDTSPSTLIACSDDTEAGVKAIIRDVYLNAGETVVAFVGLFEEPPFPGGEEAVLSITPPPLPPTTAAPTAQADTPAPTAAVTPAPTSAPTAVSTAAATPAPTAAATAKTTPAPTTATAAVTPAPTADTTATPAPTADAAVPGIRNADLDSSGRVDISDLAILLSTWGTNGKIGEIIQN